MQVLSAMASIVGYDKHDGLFSPGGSISNMYGMLLARYRAFPEAKVCMEDCRYRSCYWFPFLISYVDMSFKSSLKYFLIDALFIIKNLEWKIPSLASFILFLLSEQWLLNYESLFTCSPLREELSKLRVNSMKVPLFPVHYQFTERCVKEVSRAPAASYGKET